MSGKKAYHVDMSAWFQRQVRERLTAVLEPAVLEDLRTRTRLELQGDLDAMRARQEEVDATVRGLSDHAQVLERQTNVRLRDHLATVDRTLRQNLNMVSEQVGQVRALVDEESRRLRTELADARAEARRETAELRAAISDDKQRAGASATTWLSDALAIRDLIVHELPHERYAPGAIARFDQRLATVQSTLEQGYAEAALAGGQAAYHELSDLRVDLELQHREWTLLRAAAAAALATVRRSAEQSEQRPAHGLDGEEVAGAVLDVDHWSRGSLGELKAKLADAENAVRAEDSPMSIGDLRRVIDTHAPQYADRLEDLIEGAEQRLIASQLRANVAQEVIDTLDRVGGYLFVSGRYNDEDFREAYYTRLEDAGHNEIVVEVASDHDRPLASTVRILSYDHDVASEERRQARAKEITQALRDQGLPVPDPVAESGEPDPRYLELASPGSQTVHRPVAGGQPG